ncbi:MAG TPA: sterol desaturase family protein [Mycobacteriales bacterium]|nr:sterol desaturase family protein [Mycobacteriales bacterium]
MTLTALGVVRGREAQPDAYTAPGLDLRGAFGIFTRTFSARFLGPLVIIALAVRIALGGWRWWDLGVLAIILAAQPFTEWIVHVTVLHLKPRRLGPITIDPLSSRRHRQHHADPKVLGLVLVPRPVMIGTCAVAVLVFWLVTPDLRLALTGIAASYAMYLTYEWVHFLIHSSYRPQHWYYRYIWRAHRLHHFRNENYWFGVTVHVADHVLRTFPAKDAVPVSPTAFTLGVDATA